MLKFFRFLSVTLLLLAGNSFFQAQVAAATDSPLPTVQIVSYVFTKNNDVTAEVGGSGTLISSDGLILTNNHVVEKDDDETYDIFAICLTFDPQKEPQCEYTAELIARNREMDAALLQLHSTDIRGKALPKLPFLTYDHGKKVKEEDVISIVGYPGIGLDTVTFTKGQVSGFEEINEFTYVKTDTTIAPGNSGGTVLDAAGNFLGIPTYGLSTFGSSLGYFLDIAAAVEWIREHQNDPVTAAPEGSRAILSAKLQRENDAREEKKYLHPFSPRFEIVLPEGWEFSELERYSIMLQSKNEIKNYRISLTLQEMPFQITDEYLKASVFDKLERNKDFYTNYERVATEFKGARAFLITYDFADTKSVNYIIPYGGTLFFLSYEYDLKTEDAALREYQKILDGIKFTDPPTAPLSPQTLTREDPPFAISTVGGWHLLENRDPRSEDLIVQFFRPENTEGEISVSSFEISEADQKLSNAELLRQTLESFEFTTGFRLVSTNDEVVLDGLPGIALTYVYQGEELNQTRKTSKIYLRDGDEGYFIQYDDLDTNYDRYLPDFIAILNSFQNLNPENQSGKGEYSIGSLDVIFSDITYHRYEQAIAELKNRNIVEGYRDNSFRPEKAVGRAEALKVLIASKAVSEEKQNKSSTSKELQQFANETGLDFSDTENLGELRPYLRFARDHKIVQGFPDGSFRPYSGVTVAEFTKMLLTLYQIPTWQPVGAIVNASWHKPYLDKAFELNLIPYGIYEPGHILTRGEMAFMVAELLEQVEDRYFGF